MSFISKKERKKLGFSNNYEYCMENEYIAKYEINIHNLYSECEEKIRNLLRLESFCTGQMITKNGYQTLKLTKEKNKILVEYDDIGPSFESLITKNVSDKEFEEIVNKTIDKFKIDDYDVGDPIFAEYIITEPTYEKIAEAVDVLKSRIEKRMFEVEKHLKKVL